jgi:hypothetical protein
MAASLQVPAVVNSNGLTRIYIGHCGQLCSSARANYSDATILLMPTPAVSHDLGVAMVGLSEYISVRVPTHIIPWIISIKNKQ